MKKVGIASCYFKENYGSVLQAFATQEFLSNNGIENETINVDSNIDFKKGKRKYYISQISNFSFVKSKLGMIKFLADKRVNKKLSNNVAARSRKYKEFRSNFNLSRSINTYKDLGEYSKNNYSAVIVGSDQLWLPVNVVAGYYTLEWVPSEVSRISYSTSFGVSKLPKKYYEKYRSFLDRIQKLSVREKSGQKLIKDITGRESTLVCDPTILLNKKQWEAFSGDERLIKEEYIFCYFLGNNIKHRKFAERLKNKTGCKILSINHADEYVRYSDKYCDYAPYNVGPREWVNLLKNAKYICTDSFHGTVFSIIFNKQFFDFRRHSQKNANSTNSRLDSLLEVAGIDKGRILTGDEEDIDNLINTTIDWGKVNKNIESYRKQSADWLKQSIGWRGNEKTIS